MFLNATVTIHFKNLLTVDLILNILTTILFFINLFMAVLGLHCFARALSAVHGLLIAVSSVVVEHRL